MDFYERLTALMKERGLSHKMLENALGISNGAVSKWNKSTPNVKTLKKLEEYFGVTTDYLLTGKEKEMSLPEQADLWIAIRHNKELLNALEKYMKLSDEKKKHVLDTIDMLSEVEND